MRYLTAHPQQLASVMMLLSREPQTPSSHDQIHARLQSLDLACLAPLDALQILAAIPAISLQEVPIRSNRNLLMSAQRSDEW